MTDTTEERLTRLAGQRGRGSRQTPAQVSKIIAAGLSTSMVLGLVAVMGWTAQSDADEPGTVGSPVVPATVAPTGATVPAQIPVTIAVPDPSSTAPSAVPAIPETASAAAPQPVVVELTVPAAQPAAGGGGAVATSSQSN